MEVQAPAVFRLDNVTLRDGIAATTTNGYGGAMFITGGSATLSQVTVTNNRATSINVGYGGGLTVTGGTVTVSHGTFSGNTAATEDNGSGGAIFIANGTVNVNSSTLSGNTAANSVNGFGGAVYVEGGVLTINQTTISGNTGTPVSSGGGGGTYMNSGTVTVKQSTISNNLAAGTDSGFGGAIETTGGAITILHTPIAGNTATILSGFGGGLASTGSGTMTVRNTLVAFNAAPDGGANCIGTMVNGGGNLAWPAGTGCPGFLGADPKLEGGATPLLKQNGGPTQTIALLAGSAAANAGVAGFCTYPNTIDQRGFGRDSHCHSGAFEFGAGVPGDGQITGISGPSPAPRAGQEFSSGCAMRGQLRPRFGPRTEVQITLPNDPNLTLLRVSTMLGHLYGERAGGVYARTLPSTGAVPPSRCITPSIRRQQPGLLRNGAIGPTLPAVGGSTDCSAHTFLL